MSGHDIFQWTGAHTPRNHTSAEIHHTVYFICFAKYYLRAITLCRRQGRHKLYAPEGCIYINITRALARVLLMC